MKIFPNSIPESIWRAHLTTYSPTLFEYTNEYSQIISSEVKGILPNNIYVCPLCIRKYFSVVNNEISGNSEFSLDHLPPESIGGKFKVLTCKSCNNSNGPREERLLDLVNFGSIPNQRNNSIFPFTYVLNKQTGEKFPVSVNLVDSRVEITFNEKAKQYNKDLKRFLCNLHEGNMQNLQLFIASPDFDKIGLAILKSAYLICFVWWGYDFVYSKNAEYLRKVLNKEISYPTRIPTVWGESKKLLLPKGVSIVSKNGIKEAFVVGIELKSNIESFMAAVLIPNPTDNGLQKLTELDRYVKADTLTELDCITIPRTVIRQGYNIAWNILDP